MAMNMDAVLRIGAKVTGLGDLNTLQRGLVGVEGAAKDVRSALGGVFSSATFQAAAGAAAGLATGLGLAARAAISFESSMADVRKVVSGLESEAAFKEIQTEILELTKTIPIAAEGFADIYAAAGQSGIARNELKDFATLVAQVGIAFDMTAAEAGRSLSQMKVALSLTTPEVRGLADQMNYLSNNSGATARNLVEFMSRSGSAGKLAGLAAEETMALGAAMIQAGVNTEVAATSFNNMIRALSAGANMTDRQVSALRELGYTLTDAGQKESELTRVFERESQRRVEAARGETDQLRREIDRRYRDQMTALQDNSDDQMREIENGIRDRSEATIKAIRREQRDQIKLAQERARRQGVDNQRELDRINDYYESRIDSVQDATDRQMQAERRAERDRLTETRDRVEEQKQIEIKGIESRQAAVEAREKERLSEEKANAKAYAEELAKSQMEGFAERLQTDGVTAIMDVLRRISQLPEARRISVLSQVFGDEARGLAPLLANLGEAERLLGLAADKGAAAGSVLNEFQVRSDTTANKLQLMNNQLRISQILVGSQVLKAFASFDKVLGPLLQKFAQLAESQPGLVQGLILLTAALGALSALAPGIAVLMTGLKIVAGLSLGATIAGWAGAIGPAIAAMTAAFSGFLAFLTGTLLPGLVAFFSGPVGWTVLAVAAVVAMAVAFREPIGKFFSWLGETFNKAIENLKDIWNPLLENAAKFFENLGKAFTDGLSAVGEWLAPIGEFLVETWDKGIKGAGEFFANLGDAFKSGLEKAMDLAYNIFVRPWVNLFDNVLRKPIISLWEWLSDSIKQPFNAVIEFVRESMNGLLRNIGGGINAAIDFVNRLIQAYNDLPGTFDLPYVNRLEIPQFAQGGVVDRPTLALVGEGGEREYIIPESKMAATSANYLATNGGTSASMRPAQINITTGPILQAEDQQWVTVNDLMAAMRATEAATLARLRTPAGRRAVGVR